MGLCETTNYFGGLGGETPGRPYSYGQGGYLQPYGGARFAPMVDRLIGNAFPTVKFVADNMDYIRYVADNMLAIVTLAESQATQIATLQAQILVLQALVVPSSPTIVAPALSMSSD